MPQKVKDGDEAIRPVLANLSCNRNFAPQRVCRGPGRTWGGLSESNCAKLEYAPKAAK